MQPVVEAALADYRRLALASYTFLRAVHTTQRLNVFWINVPWAKNKTVNIVVVYVGVLWNDEFRNRLEIRWPRYSGILDRCCARGDVTLHLRNVIPP